MEDHQNLTRSLMWEIKAWKHSQGNRRLECGEQPLGRPATSERQHLSLLRVLLTGQTRPRLLLNKDVLKAAKIDDRSQFNFK